MDSLNGDRWWRPPRRASRSPLVVAGLAGTALAAAVLVLLLVLHLARSPSARTNLGSPAFVAGKATTLARLIGEPGTKGAAGPLLFQDLLGHSRDIYLQHEGSSPLAGWLAFEAHAPGQARHCVLEWQAAAGEFLDPCGGRVFPATGMGLVQFHVSIDAHQRVVVDLRLA